MTHDYLPPSSDYPDTLEAPAARLSPFLLLVGVFIVAAVSVSSLEGWALGAKALGGVLLGAFILRSFRASLRPSGEAFLYLAWIVWSLMAILGGPVQADQFVNQWLTIVQIWLLLLILSGVIDSRKAMLFCLGALLTGVLIVIGYSYMTGDYQKAEAGERIAGLAVNANGFGRLTVAATMVIAFLWMTKPKLGYIKHVVLIGLLIVCAAGTLFSGSRFSTLGLILFYLSWAWFCYRKLIFRRPSVLLAILLAAILGGYGFLALASQSTVGERLMSTWGRLTGVSSGGDAGRIDIYKDAIGVALKNPVVGVGLGNYILHSSRGLYAHSDYTEVAADTGLPGLLIYLSVYVVLWRRCGRIIKFSGEVDEAQAARLIRASMVTILFMAAGGAIYYNKPAWVMLAAFIGYTSAVWRRIEQQPGYAIEANGGA